MSETPAASRRLLAVLCGGFLGTLARYSLSLLIQGWLGQGWPYDILLINFSGALLLAFVSTLADTTQLISPTRRLLINTGFMGAYTTFSSLALGDILLFGQGAWLPALLYLLLSLVSGLLAILLGSGLGDVLIKLTVPARELKRTTQIDIQDDLLLPEQGNEIESDIK